MRVVEVRHGLKAAGMDRLVVVVCPYMLSFALCMPVCFKALSAIGEGGYPCVWSAHVVGVLSVLGIERTAPSYMRFANNDQYLYPTLARQIGEVLRRSLSN